jgi:hypothetical protein
MQKNDYVCMILSILLKEPGKQLMNLKTILAAIAFPAVLVSCKKDADPVTSNVNLSKGLVAYYPFNGNANDESGNGNNGTLVNNGKIDYDERGFAASALNCHRNGDGVRVPNTGKFNFDTAITVSLNVMLRDYAENAILTFVNYNNGTAEKFSIGNNGMRLGMFVADNNDICSAITYSPGGPYHTLIATQTYQLSEQWYNVIGVFQKGKGSIYINGVLNGTTVFPASAFNICSSADLLIGSWIKNTPSSAINGIVDEVRIYNRTLTADEIKQLATSVSK